MKKVGIIKRIFALLLVFLISINSFAAVVSDNDGSAFITKAEFDSLKNNFQSQIDSYNQSIDSKIDGAIASYLAGISLSQAWNLNATTGINFRNQLSNDTNYNRFLLSHNRYTSVKTVASVVSFSPDPNPEYLPNNADETTSGMLFIFGCKGASSSPGVGEIKLNKIGKLADFDFNTGSGSYYWSFILCFKFYDANTLDPIRLNIDGTKIDNYGITWAALKAKMIPATLCANALGVSKTRYSKVDIMYKFSKNTSAVTSLDGLETTSWTTVSQTGTGPTVPGSDPVIGRRDAAAFSDYDVASHTGGSHSTQLLCDDDGKLINCYARDTGILSQWNISRFRYHDESSTYTNANNMQDTGYTSDIVGDGTHASLQNWSFATSQTFGSSVDPQTSTTTTGTVWGNFSNYLLYAQYKPTNLISQYGKAGDTTTYHAINNNLEIFNNGGALTYTTVPATSLDQTITGYYFDNTNKVIKSGNVTLKSPQIKLPNHTLKAKDAKIYEFFTPNLTDKNKDPIHMGEGFLLGYNDKEYQNAKVKLSFKLVNESGAVQASKKIDYLISDKKFDKCELTAGATQYNSTTTCTTNTSGIVDVTVPIGNTPEHAEIWLNACAQDAGLIVLIENLEIN